MNGNVITKVKYPVSFRDKIIIEIPAPTELEIKPEKMDLDILYEDNDVIVIVSQNEGCHIHFCGTYEPYFGEWSFVSL